MVHRELGGANAPWRAGEEVVGDWEKVSRSRRIADDCFRAELKREFCCDERHSGQRSEIHPYHDDEGIVATATTD